jgi:hypothetical protein
MNISDAANEVLINADAGNASIVVSKSGMGKSQMGYATFKKWQAQQGEKVNCGFGQIFLATQSPADLIGYQFKGEKTFDLGDGETRKITVTDPSVPLWMISMEGKPAFMYDKFWLVIDEYGQGEADTKRAAAEILLNGGTAPWYLPPGSVRLALTNEGTRYGVTKDFDFCIARRTRIEVTPDVKGWLDWADKPYSYQGGQWMVQPVVKAWAQTNPGILFEDEPKEQGPWCNPRTLCAADRYLQMKAKRSPGGAIPTDSSTQEMVAGTIGMAATVSLMGFLQFRLSLPSYEDVVQDPANTPIPKKADLLLLMAYELAGRAELPHLGECIEYISRMPKDMGVTFISALLRRDYKNFTAAPAMQAWINRNASLVSVIASLSA